MPNKYSNTIFGIILAATCVVFASATVASSNVVLQYPGITPFSQRRQSHFGRRRRSSSSTVTRNTLNHGLDFLSQQQQQQQVAPTSRTSNSNDINAVIPCRSLMNTLLRGSLLRIASDLSGGTPLESIKTRVTITKEGPWEATRAIVKEQGFFGLYTGTPSRTVEGALIGAVFMLGSVVTKTQLKSMGCPPTVAALAGGLVGGVAQSVVMTPAGMVFTALSANQRIPGREKENAITICQRVIREKGILGMYVGSGPMCIRQASNWASRSGFTEIARSVFGLSKYGMAGELASGIIGGVGSCWNTPIETIRVFSQRDVSIGKNPKSMSEYWTAIVDESGYPGLFRGVTPRAIQAIWQTTFLVVVPNLMGI